MTIYRNNIALNIVNSCLCEFMFFKICCSSFIIISVSSQKSHWNYV